MAVRIRNIAHRLPIIPYVCPDGRIVDKQWAVSVNDRVLKADDEKDLSGRSVHVHRERAREGYVLLEDLYTKEGFREGHGQYLGWARSVYFGSHKKAFPEELLPKEVLRRRKEAAAGRVETWTPSIDAPARDEASE